VGECVWVCVFGCVHIYIWFQCILWLIQVHVHQHSGAGEDHQSDSHPTSFHPTGT